MPKVGVQRIGGDELLFMDGGSRSHVIEMAETVLTEHRAQLDTLSQLLMERETIDKVEFEALLAGADPEEVFKARDEAKKSKASEAKRQQRQRRSREEVSPGPESLGQVAPGGVSTMSSRGEEWDKHR